MRNLTTKLLFGLAITTALTPTAHALDEISTRYYQTQHFIAKWRAANYGLFPELAGYNGADRIKDLPRAPVPLADDCQYDEASFRDELEGTPQLSSSIFRKRLCYQKVPSRFQEAFAPGYDVPADFVNLWTSRRILDSLRAFTDQLKTKPPVDMAVYLAMNQRAVDLWDRMVASEGSAEAARAAYFRAEFAGTDGVAIRAEATALHQNVVDFLRTTGFGDTLFDGKTPETFGEPPLPFLRSRLETHPLLMQIFAEIIADWFPTETKKSTLRDWAQANLGNPAALRASENIMRLMALLPMSGLAPMGLWPTAQRTLNYYYWLKSDNSIHAADLFMSPAENASRAYVPGRPRRGLIEWVNPLSLLLTAVDFAVFTKEDQASVEPDLRGRQPMFFAPGAMILTPDAYALSNVGPFIQAYREISARYGVTRDTLFRE